MHVIGSCHTLQQRVAVGLIWLPNSYPSVIRMGMFLVLNKECVMRRGWGRAAGDSWLGEHYCQWPQSSKILLLNQRGSSYLLSLCCLPSPKTVGKTEAFVRSAFQVVNHPGREHEQPLFRWQSTPSSGFKGKWSAWVCLRGKQYLVAIHSISDPVLLVVVYCYLLINKRKLGDLFLFSNKTIVYR